MLFKELVQFDEREVLRFSSSPPQADRLEEALIKLCVVDVSLPSCSMHAGTCTGPSDPERHTCISHIRWKSGVTSGAFVDEKRESQEVVARVPRMRRSLCLKSCCFWRPYASVTGKMCRGAVVRSLTQTCFV